MPPHSHAGFCQRWDAMAARWKSFPAFVFPRGTSRASSDSLGRGQGSLEHQWWLRQNSSGHGPRASTRALSPPLPAHYRPSGLGGTPRWPDGPYSSHAAPKMTPRSFSCIPSCCHAPTPSLRPLPRPRPLPLPLPPTARGSCSIRSSRVGASVGLPTHPRTNRIAGDSTIVSHRCTSFPSALALSSPSTRLVATGEPANAAARVKASATQAPHVPPGTKPFRVKAALL